MHFELEALDAHEGDCLLLHYGDGIDPSLIVIDGGPPGVWKERLRPRLTELRDARRGGGRLPIEILMVSHIDDDHVGGVQRFLTAEDEQRERGEQQLTRIGTLWHNAFEGLVGIGGARPADSIRTAVTEADERLAAVPGAFGDADGARAVLASVAQGRDVRDAAKRLSIPANASLGGLITSPHAPVDLSDGLRLTVLGPRKDRVDALQTQWARETASTQRDKTRLAEIVDQAVANLSSIVVLAERGGRSMLLTGDARGDDVIEGLRMAGRLDGHSRFRCDLLKVPHHGSNRNVDQAFFETVVADHYVFSANGRHGNPDLDTLDDLIRARGEDVYTMYFTNELRDVRDHLDATGNARSKFNVVYRAVDAPSITVRL